MINFYHHYSFSGPTLVAGGILFRYEVFVSSFLLFVYIKETNKCMRSTQTSSLFPKRGDHNAKKNDGTPG